MAKGLKHNILTASGIARTGEGFLHHILIDPPATYTAEVLIYDNTSGSGTIIFRAQVETGSVKTEEYTLQAGGKCFETGCYVTFSSGTGRVIVYWQE